MRPLGDVMDIKDTIVKALHENFAEFTDDQANAVIEALKLEGFVLVPKDSLKVALSWMNEDIDPWQMGCDSFAELYEHKPILEALIEAQEQGHD